MSYNPWFNANTAGYPQTSVAAIPAGAPTDVNSPEYAIWYQNYMAQYQAAQYAMVRQQQQQMAYSAVVQTQHRPEHQLLQPQPQQIQPQVQQQQQVQAQPQMTKMERAMAELSAKSSGTSPSKILLQNQDMVAKAAQFKAQTKKPLYIPVKSVSASTPTPSTSTNLSTELNGFASAKMRLFISRVFEAAGEERKKDADDYLLNLVEGIKKKGAMNETEWDKMPVPAFLRMDSGDKGPLTYAAAAASASTDTSAMSSPSITKKRKKFSLDLLEDRGNNTANAEVSSTSASALLLLTKKKHPKLTSVTENESDVDGSAASPSLDHLPPHLRHQEAQRREERARRFQSGGGELSAAQAKQKRRDQIALANERARLSAAAARGEENRDVIDWDEYTIVGLSRVLEKSYLRLTSAPDPATVRPLSVLRQTLELLSQKWKQDQNYTYICDQFKSLRQDLTVQRIKNEFTVKVYESHARIALEKGDVGEYNQCQAQLKELYRHGLAGSKDEFLGYRILYMVFTMNRTEQVKILSELTPAETQSPPVRHALGVRMAVSCGDYHTLFQLYNACPFMGVYLMDLFVERERIRALRILSRAFRPTLKVAYLAKELGFVVAGTESGETFEAGVKECIEFLRGLGTPFVPGPEVEVETTVKKGKKTKVVKTMVRAEVAWHELAADMKLAAPIFAAKASEGVKVDIKGQIA